MRFVSELVLVYLWAVLVFHDGVRNNDTTTMRAGRAAFLPVWFGRNHPFYRQIILHDELERLRYPAAVREQAERVEAVTKCLPNKHEGGQTNSLDVPLCCAVSHLNGLTRHRRCA